MKLTKYIKTFILYTTVSLLLSGCTPVQAKEEAEVKIKEEESVETALLSCFTHLQNLEFDEANSYVYTTDESYLFKPMELEWSNEIFYNNWSVKIKNIDLKGETARVLVDMTICNVYEIGMDALNFLEESGKDYRDMTEEEITQTFYEMVPQYLNTSEETIIMSKINGSWKLDFDKTKALVPQN